jgi:hypothetical protein
MSSKKAPPNFFAQFGGPLLAVTWGIEVKLKSEVIVNYFHASELIKLMEVARKLRELHPSAQVKVIGGDFASQLK